MIDWAQFVAQVIHPQKVAIAEAHDWIGLPLSATDLTYVFCGQEPLGNLAYHQRGLAEEFGLLEIAEEIPRRGSMEKKYRLAVRP